MPGNCRILVEFEDDGVRLFMCNRGGKILDEEFFKVKKQDTPEESYERAHIVHSLVYDALNYGVNGRSSSKGNDPQE